MVLQKFSCKKGLSLCWVKLNKWAIFFGLHSTPRRDFIIVDPISAQQPSHNLMNKHGPTCDCLPIRRAD